MVRFCLLFFCSLVFSELSRAQTNFVVPSTATPTIQAAIIAAANGDTVMVSPGIYNENIDFLGKSITVVSSRGPASTTLDGGGLMATVVFHNGETSGSVLSGFTIQHGGVSQSISYSYAGGTYVPQGGIYSLGSSPTIVNNVITNNTCTGITSIQGSGLIQANEISGTIGGNSSACIYDAGSPGASDYNGTGISIITPIPPANLPNPTYSLTVTRNTIENNVQGVHGGLFEKGGFTIIEDNVIRNNTSSTVSGLTCFGNDLIRQNLIYNNLSNGDPGYLSAVQLNYSGGTFDGFEYFFVDNVVANNSTSGSPALASEVYFMTSSADYLFANNIIVGSTPYPATYIDSPNNTQPYFAMTASNNDVFNAAGGPANGGLYPLPIGQYGNIAEDPKFRSAQTGDFHLLAGSPVIDVGNSNLASVDTNISGPYSLNIPPLTLDFDGNARIQDATGLGYGVQDMGPYEYSGIVDNKQTGIALSATGLNDNSEELGQKDSNGNPVAQIIQFTVLLTSTFGTPTGSVTFTSDGNSFPFASTALDSSGSATADASSLGPGLHTIAVSYPGDGIFSPASAPAMLIYIQQGITAIQLTSSLNPSQYGTTVTLTTKTTSNSGNQLNPITLSDGGAALATLNSDSSGTATFTTTALALGSHYLKAYYAGTTSIFAASAYLLQNVKGSSNSAAVTLTSSLNPASLGSAVNFTAKVTSPSTTPTGSVSFTDGSTLFSTVPLDATGNAIAVTSTLPPGLHTITATFLPTGTFTEASDSLEQEILAPTLVTLTVSPPSGTSGFTLFSLTATVTGNPQITPPTGTITFTANGAVLGTSVLVDGKVSLPPTFLPGGAVALSCSYSGDVQYAPSHCNIISTDVGFATSNLTLTTSASPVQAFSPLTFTATLGTNAEPVVGSQITIYIDAVEVSQKTTNSQGIVIYKPQGGLNPGRHTVTAVFAGDATLSSSTTTITEVVNSVSTNATLAVSQTSSALGPTVTLTATVVGGVPNGGNTPTGFVTFYSNGLALKTVALAANGITSYSTSSLSSGVDAVTCTYSGDAIFTTSNCNVVPVTIPTFTIMLSPSTISLASGQTATIDIQLASVGTFGGPVTLSYGSMPQYARVTISPETVALAAGQTASSTLILNTFLIAGKSDPNRPGPPGVKGIFLAVLLVFFPTRKRRSGWIKISIMFVASIVLLVPLIGCDGGYFSETVAAGTYMIPVTATDGNQTSKTAVLTLEIQ